MSDASRVPVIGISGSAPGDAGTALPVARISRGEATLIQLQGVVPRDAASSLHEAELDEFVRAGMVTLLHSPVMASPDDIVLYASPQMLRRLDQCQLNPWQPHAPICVDKHPAGYRAILDTRAAIRARRRQWLAALLAAANTAGRCFLRMLAAGDHSASDRALVEIESIANLALYCSDDPQALYTCYLRIAFAMLHSGNVMAWQRLYEQAVKPDLPSITIEQLRREVDLLGQQYRARLDLEVEARTAAIDIVTTRIMDWLASPEAPHRTEALTVSASEFGPAVVEEALFAVLHDAKLSHARRTQLIQFAADLPAHHQVRVLLAALEIALARSQTDRDPRSGWREQVERIIRLINDLAPHFNVATLEKYRACLVSALRRSIAPHLALHSALRLETPDDGFWYDIVHTAIDAGLDGVAVEDVIRQTWPTSSERHLDALEKNRLLRMDSETPDTYEKMMAALECQA